VWTSLVQETMLGGMSEGQRRNEFALQAAYVVFNLLIQALDLAKLAYDRGQFPKLGRFHIYNVDALARPTGMFYYAQFNTLLAEEADEVEQIKRREAGSPYVGVSETRIWQHIIRR